MVIKIAHDFICPWCFIGANQTKRLKSEFGVEFDWLSYELMPEELPWDDPKPQPEPKIIKTKTPSRFQFALLAEGIELPKVVKPKKMRSHNVLEAVEFMKEIGDPEPFIYKMYEEFWTKGTHINDPETLIELSKEFTDDTDDLAQAIAEKRFKDRIIPFDDDAYESGVFYVPTLWIGENVYAEESYKRLSEAIREVFANSPVSSK